MFRENFWNNSMERFAENKITIKEYVIAKIDEFLNTSTLTPYRVLARCKRNEIEELLQELYRKAPPGRLAEYVWNYFENVDSTKSEMIKLSMLLASIGEEIDKNRDLIIDEKRSDEVLPLLEKRKDPFLNTNEPSPKYSRSDNIYNSLPSDPKLEPSMFEDGYPIPELSIMPSNAYNVHHQSSCKSTLFRRPLIKANSEVSSSIQPSSSAAPPMMVIIPRPGKSKTNAEESWNNHGSTSVQNTRQSHRQYPSSSTSKVTLINQESDFMDDSAPTSSKNISSRKPPQRLPPSRRRKDAVVGGLYNMMNGYHTTIRRLNEKLEKRELSPDQLRKYNAELREVKNNQQKGILQRTINNKAKKHFSPLMNQRILDGYVTYEAAVEFINHENSEIRGIMQTVMNETVKKNSNFWMNAISSRVEWYQSFLDLKKYKSFEEERLKN